MVLVFRQNFTRGRSLNGAQLASAQTAQSTIRQGRPGHPVEVLLRVMLLQHIYGLSDPQAEEQIGDRLSFRHFLGLGLEGGFRTRRRSAGFGTPIAATK